MLHRQASVWFGRQGLLLEAIGHALAGDAVDDAANWLERLECQWQRDQLPGAIRALVLDDQRLRNDICWSVFEC